MREEQDVNRAIEQYGDTVRSHTVPLDELLNQSEELTPDNSYVLEAVLSLPEKYRDVVYLYFYEEYSAVEISRILRKKTNTIYTLLTRSKRLLKEKLGGGEFE